MVRSLVWLPVALGLLTGCANTVQTTSGAAYRAARPEFDPKKGPVIDQEVDQAAAIEPLLRFPARLGLARIQGGQVVAVPPREADAWIAFAKDHADLGSFVPISPLLSEMARRSDGGRDARPVVDTVRLAAARQHVDAVLIYAVGGSSEDAGSALSLADLTIIGAYLVPSRSVKGEATASGLLVDVRNGYPYGTVSAAANADGFVRSVGSAGSARAKLEDAEVDAVGKLAAETGTMVTKLQAELQGKELAAARAARRLSTTAPLRHALPAKESAL